MRRDQTGPTLVCWRSDLSLRLDITEASHSVGLDFVEEFFVPVPALGALSLAPEIGGGVVSLRFLLATELVAFLTCFRLDTEEV